MFEDDDSRICATKITQLQTLVADVEKCSAWSRLLSSTRKVFHAKRKFKAKLITGRQNELHEACKDVDFPSDEIRARHSSSGFRKKSLFKKDIFKEAILREETNWWLSRSF